MDMAQTKEERNAYKAKWSRDRANNDPEYREKLRLKSQVGNWKKKAERFPRLNVDLSGQKFGKLTVVRRISGERSRSIWECNCECGTKGVAVKQLALKGGWRTSCDCLKKGINKTHGYSRTPEFRIWTGVKTRCYNGNVKYFKHYGGRGIGMCDRWRSSFSNFLEDMGQRPSDKHSIDRINVDGNYEPSNCKWSTYKEQRRNTRAVVLIEHNGRKMCMKDWADELGISNSYLHDLIKVKKLTMQEVFERIKIK